jgi:hypothetical protein
VIEGFDFSMPSTSSISMPSTSSISSLTSSLPSMPSLSSSDWGPIGPLPDDNVLLPETIEKLKQIYADNKLNGGFFRPETASYFITEAEAQDFIKNLKWVWSDKLITCYKDMAKKKQIDDASKAGKPAPTDEEIAKMMTQIDDMQKSMPARSIVFILMMLGSPCITDLKEFIFYKKIAGGYSTNGISKEALEEMYKIDDNKYLNCASNKPQISSWNSTTGKTESTPTTYSEFPTLVKGFQFITPVADFNICNPTQIQKSAYSLDGSVSPFYQAYWGVPSGSSSSSTTDSTSASVSSSSSDDPTAVLKDMKTKLNSMSLN